MASATAARIQMGGRISDKIVRFSGRQASFTDTVFGFLEVDDESLESSCDSGDWVVGDFMDDEADDGNSGNAEENRAFWEAQDQLLQATLMRSNSLESKIRQATKEALKELGDSSCVCQNPVAGVCRNCLQLQISKILQKSGYNCAICKSKWRSSPDIPAGEHTYLEVVDNTNPKKGEVRVIIELNFQAEFEMGRASEEYNLLVSRLPKLFVGKAERLRAVIKILCSAAKKCMKQNKIHMGPWRKYKYMQAKWFGNCERAPTLNLLVPVRYLNRPVKSRISMLSFDLACTTRVEVV